MTKPRYRFVGRHDGVYYWARPVGRGLEEIIYCSVDYFWRKR